MASLNEATLIGNLCSDPEVRSLNNGGEVVNLRLATNEAWKDKDGNRQERAEFHSITIFNEGLGKVAKQYLKKGSRAFIRGQIQTRRWQDQSGAERYSTEIVLQRFRGELVLLDSKGQRNDAADYTAPQTGGQAAGYDDDLDDDVPFATNDPAWESRVR